MIILLVSGMGVSQKLSAEVKGEQGWDLLRVLDA